MTQYNGQKSLPAGAYTLLGTGPMSIELISLQCPVEIIVSDSQPAVGQVGDVLSQQRISMSVSNSTNVWAMPISNSGTYLPAVVNVLLASPSDGVDATGITPPTGGSGIRGWLSGIYSLLKGTLTVSITNPTATIAQVSTRDVSGNANGISGNPFYSVNVEAGTPWSYAAATGGITTATSVALAAADASGRSNYLRKLQLINTGATATEVYVANGATAIWRIKLPASMTSPIAITFDDFELVTSANTALNLYVVTAGGAVYANAQGFLK